MESDLKDDKAVKEQLEIICVMSYLKTGAKSRMHAFIAPHPRESFPSRNYEGGAKYWVSVIR